MSDATTGPVIDADRDDPNLWLEDVEGEDALTWVRARNQRTVQDYATGPAFEHLTAELRGILDAKDRIPGVSKHGDHLYNFWTDADHARGLWRRTTLDSYRTDEPEWDVLLDVDALNRDEGEDWVFHGAALLRPAASGDQTRRRALVNLSHGGSDSSTTREFDLLDRRFVPEEEGGFVRPDSKGGVSWISADEVFVTTDTGEGTMTTSGYPRIARRWLRGTPLAEAPVVFEVGADDMAVGAYHDSTPGYERDWVARQIDFYTSETYLLREGEPVRIEVPHDAEAFTHRDDLLIWLRSDWDVDDSAYPAGSLLVTDLDDFLGGARRFTPLFEPSPSASLEGVSATRGVVVLTVLEDVVEHLVACVPTRDGWERSDPFPDLAGSLAISAVDATEGDEVWVTTTGFLTPTTLYWGDLGPLAEGGLATLETGELPVIRDLADPEPIKHAPERFDRSGLSVGQYFAISPDGTRIPYFQVGPADLPADGSAPTLLYGYGGFEISMTPAYSGLVGKGWLEKGGVYVVANIRGGGEYGPAWHQAALRENRHLAYEDFAAVAADLVERGVTSRPHLGTRGGSNGGLLMGNMLTQYPELFGAIVCQVPLLDMKRYSHLLAGASWMAEYGDPDSGDWEFLKTFSPYHLLRSGQEYPPTLFLSSTRDDRVHPGHARKMMAAMETIGADVHYYENIEGGHGGSADNEQAAFIHALWMTFLWDRVA